MKRTIEITVSPTGKLLIDAIGFKGPDCEEATKFLEEALGVQAQKVRKPEFLQSNRPKAQQRIGS